MVKVIIDTNVFLSGLLFGGNPEIILRFWIQGTIIFCISPALKAEIINKLQGKFDAPKPYITTIARTIDLYSEKYIPKKKVSLYKDSTDNFLLELALVSGADYLISGDKEVRKLGKYQQTKIVSPQEFIAIMTKGAE